MKTQKTQKTQKIPPVTHAKCKQIDNEGTNNKSGQNKKKRSI
jgi:hypothetical protein